MSPFIFSFVSIVLVLALNLLLRSRRFRNLPPGPASLPIVGNFHQLKQPFHRTFHDISQKYGQIFSLWFASRLVVVVSSYSAVQECFTKKDKVFANRPHFLQGKYIHYNNTTVAQSPYGDHWRNLRRIVSLEVLSSQRITSSLEFRREEIMNLVQKLAQDSRNGFTRVELKSRFAELPFNIIMRMVSGKRYYGEDCDVSDVEKARKFREAIKEMVRLGGANNFADFLALLRWFDYDGLEKNLKRIRDTIDAFLQGLIDEHRSGKHNANGMIDHLLTQQRLQPEYYTDQIIKGLALVYLGYMMNSVITVLYFNGRIYEDNDGVTFEGSKKAVQIKRGINFDTLKKKIRDKVKLEKNEIISSITCRFLVSGKYVALQICDDEDVETMIESFQQQEEMSVIELYVEKDVAGGSTFHSANSVRSCGNNLSNNELEPPRNVSNLDDDDDDDDDDYLVSNSYVEESLDEEDSVDGISDTDDEVTHMIEPLTIVEPREGVEGIQNPFWNDALHYNNINWSHPDEEDICGLEMPSSFNVGQELYVGMDFDSKDAVKNALKQYVMKVHQSFKVLETKSHKYIVCCPNKSAECPCPFYMRAILSKKTDSWKVTQWGGPHTCLNMSVTQDHDKLDSDLIATCVVGMIREDPSIKVSLIQERINSEFSYKVSYKKAWLAKQKAIAIEYGDWEESYGKLDSWLKHMQNNSPGSYFQILHDDFIVGNRVSREHRQFYRVFWTFGQCKEAFNYCKPIIQVDGTHLYGKYRGTLLMATSQDGNGGVLPLAFAVVEGETLTAWSWFLAHLREHVTDKNGICLISDRHASIKSAVANEALGWQPPHAYHVYCVRHIASNFNRKFNNAKQKEMLKKLGYTPCKHIFDQNLEKFRQLSPAIATWIDRISKEKWTMAYDKEGRRYGHMTTNLSECVNKVLKDCRNIPITALVKSTYSRCRKYFVDRGRQAQRQLNAGQLYCSKVVKELRKNQEQACSHIVRIYDIHSTRFEVEETFNPITQRGGQKWAVNLNDRYCQCGKYSALHYPCSHIIAACGYVSINYFQYVDVVYTNDHILKAYSAQWWPLGNEAAIPPSDESWTLIPDPSTIRAKGRPKSTRIRNEMDWLEPSEHRQKCSRCGVEGHNRRRCPMQSEHGSC